MLHILQCDPPCHIRGPPAIAAWLLCMCVGERRDGSLLGSGRGKWRAMAAGANIGGRAAGRKQRGCEHLDRGAKWGHSFLEAALGIETNCNHGRSDVGVRPIVRALAVSIQER
jgi:hypothetical protein